MGEKVQKFQADKFLPMFGSHVFTATVIEPFCEARLTEITRCIAMCVMLGSPQLDEALCTTRIFGREAL